MCITSKFLFHHFSMNFNCLEQDFVVFFKTKGWICIIAESFDLKMFWPFIKLLNVLPLY